MSKLRKLKWETIASGPEKDSLMQRIKREWQGRKGVRIRTKKRGKLPSGKRTNMIYIEKRKR